MYSDRYLVEHEKAGFAYRIGKREYGGGEFTRFVVITFSPGNFEVFYPGITESVFYDIYDLSVNYVMKRTKSDISPVFLYPYLEDTLSSVIEETPYGERITDSLSVIINSLSILAERGEIRIEGGRFVSCDPKDAEFLNLNLEHKKILFDKREDYPLRFIGVYPFIGFVDPYYSLGNLMTNSHFFLMEPTDITTPFSLLGEPVGGLVINNEVKLPYLYRRSALFLYRNGTKEVKKVSIEDMKVLIGNTWYVHGENALFYRRPEYRFTPTQVGWDTIIVNNRIVGEKEGGGAEIPDAGFVIHTEERPHRTLLNVKYRVRGERDVLFSIQGGPWLVKNGEAASFLDDPFYNGEPISFPPTVFPASWGSRHAARTAIGVKANGEIVIIGVEGTNESTYVPGLDSRGFTLSELSEIMYDQGVTDGINLDGGGSSQIYLDRGRFFSFADRRGFPGLTYRRAIPLTIRFSAV